TQMNVRAARVESEKPWSRYLRAMCNPIDPFPYTWSRYRSARLRAHLRWVLRQTRYDLIHCDHVQVAYTLEGLTTPPRVLNAHNAEHVLVRGVAARARPAWRKAIITWQASKTLGAEQRIYRIFDRCIAVSQDDGAEIQRLAPRTLVSIVPNGVD